MIRQFQKPDIRQVMEIWLRGNEDAHPFIPGEYWRSYYEQVQQQILQSSVSVYEENGEIRGFIGVVDGYIAGIFVDSACRCRGIGRQLLDYAKQTHDALELSVYKKNPRAVSFYLREGFSVLSEGLDEETGETEYRMIWKSEGARKTVLFIAMSLDGYIADSRGGVDWLNGPGNDEETTDTYSDFVKDVDTVLMGWNTYRQIVTELSPGQWVYEDLTSYVFTHRENRSTEQIRFTSENPADLLKSLKGQRGKDIWICGGANLIRQLMGENLIDRYYISVIPILLGSGLRLFGEFPNQQELCLVRAQRNNGIVALIYDRKRPMP